jgi:very-short-patch-repair endonuclease
MPVEHLMDTSRNPSAMARRLRRTLTLPEALLWKGLKARRLEGLHFRKQHPLGPYILDFYCSRAHLCVEVDGSSHGTASRPIRDAHRDEWLRHQGVETLRLRAGLVLEDIDAALSMVRTTAISRIAAPQTNPPPRGRWTAQRAGGGLLRRR